MIPKKCLQFATKTGFMWNAFSKSVFLRADCSNKMKRCAWIESMFKLGVLFRFSFPTCVGVGRARRYCNTETTRGNAEASLCASPSSKNQINIIVTQCATNQILN